jgi:hypothetical protein
VAVAVAVGVVAGVAAEQESTGRQRGVLRNKCTASTAVRSDLLSCNRLGTRRSWARTDWPKRSAPTFGASALCQGTGPPPKDTHPQIWTARPAGGGAPQISCSTQLAPPANGHPRDNLACFRAESFLGQRDNYSRPHPTHSRSRPPSDSALHTLPIFSFVALNLFPPARQSGQSRTSRRHTLLYLLPHSPRCPSPATSPDIMASKKDMRRADLSE